MVRVKDFDTLFTKLTHRKPGSGTDQAIAKSANPDPAPTRPSPKASTI